MSTESMPWYRSTIIVSALVSFVTKMLVIAGVISDVAPEDLHTLSNTLVLVIGGVADLVAMQSRIVQKTAPTITKK